MPFFTADDGVGIYYESWGAGDTTVIVEQGMFAPTDAAGAFTALAEEGLGVVAYDPRGVGRSDRPEPAADNYSIERLTRDSLALTDHLAVENVIALGWLDGAHRAVRRAVEQPDETSALVLCGPCLSRFTDMLSSATVKSALLELFSTGFNYGASAYIDLGMPDATEEQKDLAKTAFRDITTMEVAKAIWKQASDTDDLPLLRGVRCPAVIVAGTKDIVVPASHTREIAESLADARLVELQGAGNAMWFTRNEETLSVIGEFVRSVELVGQTEGPPG
jgi:pimeloyl-ACP methyl ester carboxylesterase